jgi:hypothetical protein
LKHHLAERRTEKQSFNATHAETADSVPSAVLLTLSDKHNPSKTIINALRFLTEKSSQETGNKQSILRSPVLNKRTGKSVLTVSPA